MRRVFSILMFFCLLFALLPAARADAPVTGSFALRDGFDLASVRCELSDGSYTLLPFEKTESGYTYTFTPPDEPYTVVPEYYSLTCWDGAVDISWYDADKTEFCLDNPAQLAGLAALVNGRTDADTPDYRVKGDLDELVSTQIDDFLLVGAGGGNQKGTVYRGDPAHDFSGKTVFLCADMDMGGVCADGAWTGPNWTPIGGKYPLIRPDSEYVIEAFFNGVLDGRGHRITNLCCDRYADKGYAYSQAVGLVGYLGELYEGEAASVLTPAVRNLSVSGSVYGRRMVGGIVGRVGSIPTGVRIENCANYAAVKNTDSKGIGGVCGAGWGKGAIVNCYNIGSVSTTYACPAGGICGSNGGMDIYNCYNVGTIDSNGNGRGRAIGGHNGGSYTVSDCYYLEGCDDDPASGGWYVGTALNVSVSCAAKTDEELRSEDFVQALNKNGAAYCYTAGSYPILLWESGEASPRAVAVQQPEHGSITADQIGEVPAGTVLTLSNVPEAGYAFRCYTMNGNALSGPYATIGENAVLSGVFEQMQAGTLILPSNPACEITATKTGTVMQDGTPVAVTDYSVKDGDPLYENDILTVRAQLYENAAPDDLNYVYSGIFRYHFAFSDGSGKETATDTGVFTVSAAINGAALTVTVEPYTTHKVWTQLGETGWYDPNVSEFTIRTARELAGFALLVKQGNDFAGKTVKLGNDISLSNDDQTFNRAVRWWDGVGSNLHPFRGVFDGCGHTISEMTAISEGSNLALFVSTDGAIIRNLTVRGEVSARGGAAAIVSQTRGTTVQDCESYVTVSASDQLAGGIAAALDGSSQLERCINRGAVSGTTGVGGIVGSVADAESQLTDCLNYGAIRGDGASGGLGGVAGKIGGSLTRCANYGAVSGKNWYVGGVVGCANLLNASVLTDCYNVGNIDNTHSYQKAATGGIIGYGNYYSLTNGFSYATITGSSGTLGGVIGLDSRRSTNRLENAVYLDTGCAAAVGGVTSPAGVKALTEAEFASDEYLQELNRNGCFALTNGKYPEFTDSPMPTPCDGGETCPSKNYTDMKATDWYHLAVDFAVENGLFKGMTDTTFEPNTPMTRGMLVTVLWRYEKEPSAGRDTFSDVKSGEWYEKAVAWAAENGIVNGVGNGKFDPNGKITREQMAAILFRYSDYKGYDTSKRDDFAGFPDKAKVSSWAKDAYGWAVAEKLITGNDGKLDPQGSATRAQVATILMRFIQNVAK